jgi:hypothetical protein
MRLPKMAVLVINYLHDDIRVIPVTSLFILDAFIFVIDCNVRTPIRAAVHKMMLGHKERKAQN